MRTEEEESDGSEDSGDGILAADYEGPGANRRGNVAAPAPAAEEDDDSSDWSSSAEAPAPAPLDDDDDISIVSVSSATAEDASERLSRAEHYGGRYPAKAAKVLRPCITAWRGGAPIDFASNPDVGTRPCGVVLLRLRAGDGERRSSGRGLRRELAGPRRRRAGSARPGARARPGPRAVDAAPRATAAPARRGALPAEDRASFRPE